ncbi:Ubiquitin conjugation factor E4 [Rhizina undulata]
MSSNPESDADTIRLKRLARLQKLSQPAQQAEGGEGSSIISSKADTSAPHTPTPNSPAIISSKISSPNAANVQVPAPTFTPQAVPGPTHPVSPRTPTQSTSLSNGLTPAEVWEDKTLGVIFQVGLQPGPRTKEYPVLDNLRKDLEEEFGEGKAPYLSTAVLDQLIIEACGKAREKPLQYLVSSWRRATKIERETAASRLDQHKNHVLKEAKRLCISYAQYCITIPDMFENNIENVKLEDWLINGSDDGRGFPPEFLNELVNRFVEEPDLVAAFETAIGKLSRKLSAMTMSDNYKPITGALWGISQIKPLANMTTNLPNFIPTPEEAPPHMIEKISFLGPFFRLSPLQSSVFQEYFSDAHNKQQIALDNATKALRLSTQTLQEQLYQITMSLIRASPDARNKVLDYFAAVINANQKRGALQVDPTTVASDGFMLNITAVLNRLCEPFMDASFSKINKIDIDYLRRDPRVDINEETKLNADEQYSKEFYSKKADGVNNFISDVFFLNVAAHHYGLGATETTHEGLANDIDEMEKHLERIQAERQRFVNTPQIGLWDRNIERLKERVDQGIAYKYALEVLLFDGLSQSRTLLFIRYLVTWLLRVVSPTHNYPQKLISLPLPEPALDQFNCLPEYFVEDIGLCFGFISRYLPQIIVTTQVDELVVFCITFLRMSTFIRKPNLKSKLVEILYYGINPYRGKATGILGDVINGHPFALKYLMNALMNFYIEIERQYYEKFNVRHHISEIIKSIWSNPAYREKLEQESKQNVDFFVRFVALLLNDVTYVLDHSLTALADIHRLQHELEGEAAVTMTQQVKAEKEKALAKAEREALSYMLVANESVAMLKRFTYAISEAFVKPEIVHRLAGMLDYNLEALVGPKCNSLRVRNPEKYRFNPKALLSEITDVYLNLRTKPPFIEAIARDGRSYKPETFAKLISVLEKNNLKGTPDIAALAKLTAMVEETKRREEEGEEELGEIPDEYLDPLMATLMQDPVILPTSRVTIDRQTIKVHLLSDPKDPFNREPLKIEEVVPNTELKQQIDAWVQERRSNRAKPDTNNSAEAMDVDG